MRISLLLLAALLALSVPAAAQPAPLTVHEALQLAEARHPALGQLRAQRAVLTHERASLTAFSAPTVGYAREGIDGGGYAEQRVTVGETLAPFPLVSARRARLAATRDAVGSDVEAQRRALRVRVKAAFVNLQYGEELVRLRTEAVALAERLLDAAQVRERVGEAAGFEPLRAEVELAQAEADLVEARRLRAQAETAALAAAGLDVDASDYAAVSPGPLGFVPVALEREAVLAGVSTLPDLTAAGHHVTAAEQGVRAARAALLPDLTVEVFPQDFGSGFETFGFTVGLRLPVALWPAARAEGEAARAEVSRRRWAERALMVALTAEAESSWAGYAAAADAVARYRAEVGPKAEALLALAEEGYHLGEIPLLALLDTRRATLDAQARYAEALRDVALHLVELERFVGRDLVFATPPPTTAAR